ncbi:MAG TPA: hypothetical protein VG899_07265 [Mycobacteriales bacterium]|nr:hypothetical protein [Mycobacteriales bacterium]
MRKSRRQLTVNSRTYAASCGRCRAVMLPNASVCRSCGGFAIDHNRHPDYDRPLALARAAAAADVQAVLEGALPVYARPNPQRVSTVLSCWPFGATDASEEPTPVTPVIELAEPSVLGFEAVVHRSDVPTQRGEMESVPATGPNPFLSAARILHAREEAQAC